MKRDASWIASAVEGKLYGAPVSITGSVQTDSRLCDPGSLYIARVGESADGHDFATSAVEEGAICAIVERVLPIEGLSQIVVKDSTIALGALARAHLADLRAHHAQRSLSQGARVPYVIGITGSAGKTTAKDLLGQILSAQGPTVYPKLSFNNEVGCPLTILKADYDTEYLVLEMGASGQGHLRYLTDIAPLDMAIVLMVGVAHLGGFGSLTMLARSKQELVEGLRADGVCLLNYDDDRVRSMAEASPTAPIFFSAAGDGNAQARAEGILIDDTGQPHFHMTFADEAADFDVPLVGGHQVSNALAAATAAHLAANMPLFEVSRAMRSSRRLSPHRMDVRPGVTVGAAQDVQVVDDSYNANPDSMAAGMRAARGLAGRGRLVAVLGEMLELGDDSPMLHAEAGRNASGAGIDILIGVGGRTEPLIAAAIEDGSQVSAHLVADAGAALDLLTELVLSGDTVFLKGSQGSNVWRVADSLLADSCDDSSQSK